VRGARERKFVSPGVAVRARPFRRRAPGSAITARRTAEGLRGAVLLASATVVAQPLSLCAIRTIISHAADTFAMPAR